ncbi:hypothetical protein Tsubulata_044940, partial [Turnera subulata]
MARNGEREAADTTVPRIPPSSSSSLLSSSSARPRVGRGADRVLVVCRCFSFITALTAILCIVVNVLSAVRSFKNGYDVSELCMSTRVFDGIFRCYAVVIGVFVVVAETEWSFVFRFSKVLEYWAGRGMLQIFVAVMTRAFPDYYSSRRELVLLQDIASYMLLACGVTYVLSVVGSTQSGYAILLAEVAEGILCIGFLKRARQQKEITREQAAKDLE